MIMKPTNSATQTQPNPIKDGLKVAFGPFFSTAKMFRGLGLALYRKENTINLTQNNYPQTP